MQKMMVALAAMFAMLFGFAAEEAATLTLAEARSQIDAVVESADKAAEVFSQLSAADQKTFLGEVNTAISKMPGLPAEKAAKFLNFNTVAVKNAKKKVKTTDKDGKEVVEQGNLAELLAEVFATVPPEALTVINEQFADNILNRALDPSVTYTDADYTAAALKLMETVRERTATVDNAEVRNTFAMLMMIRASNGTPSDLTEKLEQTFPEEIRETVSKEWVPSALGENRQTAYDPMLAAADATMAPDMVDTLRMALPQTSVPMLAELINLVENQFTGFVTDPTKLDSLALIREALRQEDDISNEPKPYEWTRTK